MSIIRRTIYIEENFEFRKVINDGELAHQIYARFNFTNYAVGLQDAVHDVFNPQYYDTRILVKYHLKLQLLY